MHPAFQLLLCFILFMFIHISVMAACARLSGITVRSISYGVGPTVLTWGKVHVKLLPLAGSLVLKDTREEELYDDDPCLDAYNFQPLWKQVLLPLSGVGMLLALSLGIMGASGWDSFVAAFGQIVNGALAPLSTAQELLGNGEAFARTHGFALAFALFSLKLCALNLLPFAGLNGGQALLAIARGGKPYVTWEETAAKWLLLPGLAILLAWAAALAVYCWRALGL
ncbi:peptidase family M50 [Janthinobacterium sp. MP5059B]|uniref:site-2 protease family protein n=1 Tax=Janthinobacterium sp. MP5059B TaxID=1766683 RepID=UPI0008759EF5|nr:site-2 protease family protein [Janthinobacterium sp. MP5059B]OEZ46343.1 peptidase family M50 [Janthinobacterium sp. MP5059B]